MAKSLSITNYKSLSNLWIRHQDRRLANSELRPVFAVDTETNQNGDIMIIADSQGNYLDDITPDSCLKFLFSKRYQGAWNFFYNLTFDAEVILKTLGEVLYDYKRTRKLEFEYKDYKLEYIPAKKLSIRKGHHSSVFFDIFQFYHTSLVNAYQTNIEPLDKEYLDFKSKRSAFSTSFYTHYPNKVRNYCIRDCKLTKTLCDHWIKLFHDAFGFLPARWISSGYLAEKVLINNGIIIPKFDEIPYNVQDIAWKSYYGGRFEILKRGFIGNAYLYDINSAYPFAFANIPDVTRGKWSKRKSIHPDALLGFFKIKCNIPDCKYVPPFPFKTDDKLIFPAGEFVTFCTLDELLVCENPKYYTILESYQYLDDDPVYPYKTFVESIYSKRMQLKQEKDPLQLPLKTILNSIYGKTAQRVGNKIGNLFCPVIASTITGKTRAMLYSFVKEHDIEKQMVSFATDSIITTKKLDVNSKVLGKFALENQASDVYVLQNGIYRFNKNWKKRGIGNIGKKQIEHVDTIERNGKLYQMFKINRVNRLRTAILSNDIATIGKFRMIERKVDLNADRKRLWFEELRDINEPRLIDSLPISLNHFEI